MKHATPCMLGSGFLLSVFSLLLAVLSLGAAVDTKELETQLRKAASFDGLGERSALDKIEAIAKAAEGSAADSAAVEKRLLIILKGSRTSDDCREFLCEQLRVVGSAASVPTLAKMAAVEKYSEMGLNGLGGIKDKSAGVALRKLYQQAKPADRGPVVTALGEQGDSASVELLAQLADGDDDLLAVVSVEALGGITSPASLKALTTAVDNGSDDVKAAGLAALVGLGNLYSEAGDTASAAKAFSAVNDNPAATKEIKASAVAGLMKSSPEKALDFVAKDLTGSSETAFKAALEKISKIPGDAASKVLSDALEKATPARKALLFGIVAGRGGAVAIPSIKQALEGSDRAMRSAAVTAAASVSSPELVTPLLVVARGADPTAIEAREALAKMEGEGINAELAKNLNNPATYPLLASRKAVAVLPQVYKALDDPNFGLRNEATALIGDLAPGSDLAKLIDLMVAGNKLGDSRSTAEAMQKITARIEDPAKRDAPILAAISKATSTRVKGTLMQALASGGSKETLALLRKELKNPVSSVRGNALKALAAWPNGEANADLLDVARNSKNSDHRRIAHRAYLEKVVSIKELDAAKDLRARSAEKQIILTSLGRMKDPKALEAAISFLQDRETRTGAANAIFSQAERADPSMKAKIPAALDEVIKAFPTGIYGSKAKALKEKVSK